MTNPPPADIHPAEAHLRDPDPSQAPAAVDAPGAPRGRERRRGAAWASAVMALAGCAVWAFWPLGSAEVAAPERAAPPVAPSAGAPAPLDLAAFNAPLWVAPPPPPPPVVASVPPPPPPVPPLRWQLLAIVREGESWRAIVYDPDADRVLSLGEGERSGARQVARVTPAGLEVRDAGGVRTLALRDGGAPP